MTFTFNGIGTGLRGTRRITRQEYHHWKPHLPDVPEHCFYLTTESFVIFWLPVIPLKTFVLVYPERKWYQNVTYIPCFFPAGKDKVYWEHVKKSWAFYLTPIVIVAVVLLVYFG